MNNVTYYSDIPLKKGIYYFAKSLILNQSRKTENGWNRYKWNGGLYSIFQL